MLRAKYLDFQAETNVCLNPFTYILEPDEELKSVAAVFAQMAYSNSDSEKCDDTEMNLVRNAVRWAWQEKVQNADTDTVYEFLMKFHEVPNPTSRVSRTNCCNISILDDQYLSHGTTFIFLLFFIGMLCAYKIRMALHETSKL